MNRFDADRLRRAHDKLAAAVTELSESGGWLRMLEVGARFHRYSPNNVLLIMIQRPDATRVAGYTKWKREFGRQVRKGEKGIAIYAPIEKRAGASQDPPEVPEAERERQRLLRGFRVTHVFDISQTDGPPLPEVRPQLLTGDADPQLYAALSAQLHAAGYRVVRERPDDPQANGDVSFTDRVVRVRPGLAPAQAVKTLAHELGHVRLHDPRSGAAVLPRDVAEVEAESVAFLVTGAHGIDSGEYTIPYVAGWAGGKAGMVLATAERVLSTASAILAAAPPPTPEEDKPRWQPARPAQLHLAAEPERLEPARAAGRQLAVEG